MGIVTKATNRCIEDATLDSDKGALQRGCYSLLRKSMDCMRFC